MLMPYHVMYNSCKIDVSNGKSTKKGRETGYMNENEREERDERDEYKLRNRNIEKKHRE
jgi:hypothetical protein